MIRSLFSMLLLLVCMTCSHRVLQAQGPTYTDPKEAGEDYQVQGEYRGELHLEEGRIPVGVQVVALGQGAFQGAAYPGGLPGDGWNRERKLELKGRRENGRVVLQGERGRGIIEGDELIALDEDGREVGRLKKVDRNSPTLGKKPPEGAVVLFDGSNTEAWEKGRMTEDGLLMQGTTSKQKFGDHTLHIEFRLPFQPEARGQARGNSGIYLQGRYEVQMLDSFGLEGKHNECGGLYSVKDPDLNMCYPPLTWQTYDIEYTAARYDDSGKVTSPPRVTVRHNGVVIHENVELPADRSTTAAPVPPGPELGPVYLQDHGNPVRYRNIWVVEKK